MTTQPPENGLRPNRRDIFRATAGVVAAGLVGGAVLQHSTESAQATEPQSVSPEGQGQPFLVKLDGSAQGKFELIVGLGFHYQVGTTGYRNGNSGETLNLPDHGVVIVTKAWDGSTPQLFQALVNTELLNEVVLEFGRVDGAVFQRITLHQAHVVSLEQYMHFNAAGHTISDDPRQIEDVAFSFNEIIIENLENGVSASDTVS